MKNFYRNVQLIIGLLWGFPQNLLGMIYLLTLYLKGKKIVKAKNTYNNVPVFLFYRKSIKGSVALGNFVFVNSNTYNISFVTKHELGHVIQSYILGPIYLLVIGLPSILWAYYRYLKLLKGYKLDYYSFYTEAWANKIAKLNSVNRF